MKIVEFEKKHGVSLIPKSKSRLMRWTGKLLGRNFMTRFWTTYRLPFCGPVISYPDETQFKDDSVIPYWMMPTLEHEMIHVEDMRSWWGLLKSALLVSLLPLPVLFSGRWYVERYAYLHNIINHGYNIDRCVNLLWSGYGWAWPKPLMKKWFYKKVAEHKESLGG